MTNQYPDLPTEAPHYEYMQPLITAANGGEASPLRYTALRNDAGYGAVYRNQDGIEQVQVLGSDGLARVEVDDNETRIQTLNITGDLLVGDDLTVNDALTVLGSSILGNGVGDSTTIAGDAVIGQDVTVQRNVSIAGETDMLDVLRITPSPGNDQAIFFRHNALGTATYASIGATNSATPAVVVKNQLGTQVATFGNDGVTLIGSLAAPIAASGFSDGDVYIHRTYWHSTTNWRYAENPAGVFGLSHNGGGTYDFTIDAAGDVRLFHSLDVDVALNVDGNTRLRGTLQQDGIAAFNAAVEAAAGLEVSGGTFTLSGSTNIDGNSGTAGQIRIGAVIVNAASLSGSEELRVVGQSRLEGATEVTTGGLLVSGGTTSDVYTANGTGTVLILSGSSQTQSTVGGAGGASALPATPRGYMKIQVGASSRLIPYYDV